MERTDSDTIALYHGYLNALHAYLQGYYTRINVLATLTGDQEQGISRTELAVALEKTIQLYRGLWNGTVIDLKTETENPDAEFLLSLVKGALYLYDNAPARITELLFTDLEQSTDQELAELIAFLAEQAYAREHFIKGLIGYGDNFNLPDVADRWRQQLLNCQRHIQEANTFFHRAKEKQEPTSKLMRELQQEGFLLPGIMCSKGADLRNLECIRLGKEGYEELGVKEEESGRWQTLGFPPLLAAYWSGYGFAPDEALRWFQAGFSEPGWAAGYYLRGIDLAQAVDLSNRGVSGQQAVEA